MTTDAPRGGRTEARTEASCRGVFNVLCDTLPCVCPEAGPEPSPPHTGSEKSRCKMRVTVSLTFDTLSSTRHGYLCFKKNKQTNLRLDVE